MAPPASSSPWVPPASGDERRLRGILLRKFPRHLLGSVPILYSWEFTADRVRSRRIWSGVINAFLHPTMERFLYHAEDRLRSHRVQNPLLIYRNDGASVARGEVGRAQDVLVRSTRRARGNPRAGSGLRPEARVMIDVGGTTTDVGSVRDVADQGRPPRIDQGRADLVSHEQRPVDRRRRQLDHRRHAMARSPSAPRASAPLQALPASASVARAPPSPTSTSCWAFSIRRPTSTAGSPSTLSAHEPSSPRPSPSRWVSAWRKPSSRWRPPISQPLRNRSRPLSPTRRPPPSRPSAGPGP